MEKVIDDAYLDAFLDQNPLSVLSTQDESGAVHAAPVYYVVNEKRQFMFITPAKTQKNINIERKGEALLTIVNQENNETVQVRGKTHHEPEKLKDVLDALAKKLNHDLEFITTLPLLRYTDQEKTVVVVDPTEIRFRKFHDDHLEEKLFPV